MTATSKEENGSSKIASLTPETKETLHKSILDYLHRSGFSKTVKRFQSEAQIQNDTWKDSSANLEEIYSKYVNVCHQTADDKDEKEDKTTKSKKKNKSSAVEDESEIPQDVVVVEESEIKPKKKKSKDETKEAKADDTVNESEVNEPKKTKEKKKKSNEEDKPATNGTENGGVDPDVVKEEKKSSKKRKRLLSDENEEKIEAIKEDKVDENEKVEINEGEKTEKSLKKQRISSTEPKTINAFQRVKIDQVEFAHEKLQDNSYWAKDGADIGYGAKAQEVLGLVRGKGFRHEKTKKKRGSYRGGQIDLQSHSIKFDYSDQE